MRTRRRFLQQLALAAASPIAPRLVTSAFASSGPDASVAAAHLQIAAAPADSLVEFVSVQTHMNWGGTVWEGEAWRPLLGDLGVRYTRSILTTRLARDHIVALHRDFGIRSSSTFNVINKDGTFDLTKTLDALAYLRDQVGVERIYAVEGPNEYTHKYKSGDWSQRLRDYQAFLYGSVKSDPQLSKTDVLAPTIWKRIVEDYLAIGDINDRADYGNLHLYNGGRNPSLFNRDESDESIDLAIADAQVMTPGKRICITETGFNVADEINLTRWTVPAEVAAKYTLRNVAELFARRDRIKQVNIYALIDSAHTDDHYGLVDVNLTPRPAYYALRNLLRLVADPGPEFEPDFLAWHMEPEDPTVRSIQLQKRDGRFMLLLWQDVESYSRAATTAIEVPPVAVAIDFGGKRIASLTQYTPTLSASAVQTKVGVTNVSLSVPDHLQVLEIVE